MVDADLVLKNLEAGSIAAPRHMLELSPVGEARLLRMPVLVSRTDLKRQVDEAASRLVKAQDALASVES